MTLALRSPRRSALGITHGRHRPDILDDDVVKLYEAGVSPQALAKKFSCSDVAIRKRLKRLGVKIRKQEPWTKDEDIILLELYPRKGVASVVFATGRSKDAVKLRARLLGIRGPGARRRDVEAKEVVRLYVDNHLPAWRIAEKLGCSKTLVLVRLKEAGIETRPCTVARLPNGEEIKLGTYDNQIRNLYEHDRLSGLRIAERLNLSTGYTYHRLGRIDMDMRLPTEVSPFAVRGEDATRILELYQQGMSIYEVAIRTSAKPAAVQGVLKRAGVKCRGPRGSGVYKGIDWDNEFESMPNEPDRVRAKRLGVTTAAVVRQRYKRNIYYGNRKYSRAPLTRRDSTRRCCYERDHYTCQICGHRLPVLEDGKAKKKMKAAHHIVHRDYYQQLGISDEAFWSLSNLITLCRGCHLNTHRHFKCLLDLGYTADLVTFRMAIS